MSNVDTVIRGGAVFTFDPMQPWAEAVAVVGGAISAVGAATEVIELAGAGTEVI